MPCSLPRLVLLIAAAISCIGMARAEEALPTASPPACAELEPALASLRRAEEASATQHWLDALAAYEAAEKGLHATTARCPAKAPLARDALLPIADRKAEAEAGIHQTLCLPAIDKAFALDNQAASLQLAKKGWAEVEALFGQAEVAWGEATALCKGTSRESALANKADSARARNRAALFLGNTAACDPAFTAAKRMLDLAKAAWSERLWEDAGLWYRKAHLAWGLAAEKCAGPKREQALKKQESAGMDAHNAVNCAPAWEKANELSESLKRLPTVDAGDQRTVLHHQVEIAWGEATIACRGAPQEKARSYAAAFARERGNVPPPIAIAPKPEAGTATPTAAAPVPNSAPAAPETLPSSQSKSPPPPSIPPPGHGVVPAQSLSGGTEPEGIIPEVTLKAGDTTFTGHFRADPSRLTLSGEGQVLWANGNVFTGTLVLGKAEGNGSMRWHNGDHYEGDWKNDHQEGKGSISYANGDRYEGDFVAGYPEGHGLYLFAASGGRYEGELRQGKPEGHGVYTWKNGDRFEGNWKNGMKHGTGRYTWAGGKSQEGQYANDQRLTETAAARTAIN